MINEATKEIKLSTRTLEGVAKNNVFNITSITEMLNQKHLPHKNRRTIFYLDPSLYNYIILSLSNFIYIYIVVSVLVYTDIRTCILNVYIEEDCERRIDRSKNMQIFLFCWIYTCMYANAPVRARIRVHCT